jgi:hypothetical protein
MELGSRQAWEPRPEPECESTRLRRSAPSSQGHSERATAQRPLRPGTFRKRAILQRPLQPGTFRNEQTPESLAIPGVLLGHWALSNVESESSGGRTRTCDPTVNSRLLYQLSYAGKSYPERKKKLPRGGEGVNQEVGWILPISWPPTGRG